jgi:hypothetical protein
LIREPLDKPCVTKSSLSPALHNLTQDPLKVFLSLVAFWQHVNGIFHRNSSKLLKPAPNLHPEIIRLRRDLVDENEPTRFNFISLHGFSFQALDVKIQLL